MALLTCRGRLALTLLHGRGLTGLRRLPGLLARLACRWLLASRWLLALALLNRRGLTRRRQGLALLDARLRRRLRWRLHWRLHLALLRDRLALRLPGLLALLARRLSGRRHRLSLLDARLLTRRLLTGGLSLRRGGLPGLLALRTGRRLLTLLGLRLLLRRRLGLSLRPGLRLLLLRALLGLRLLIALGAGRLPGLAASGRRILGQARRAQERRRGRECRHSCERQHGTPACRFRLHLCQNPLPRVLGA